jgi:hypothetical protein
MVELLFSYAVLSLIAVGFFILGRVLGTRFPLVSTVFCAFSLLVGWLMCWVAGGDLQWALWMPTSVAYQMSYSPALLVVSAAGSLCVNKTVRTRSRRLLSGALCLAVATLFAGVLLRPYFRPPQLSEHNLWNGGVCLQSHESSCVPAAASNLLHLHGLEFGERQLADFARTSLDGTPPLGSFLAVSQAIKGTELKACIQLKRPSEGIVAHLPMLAHVRFDESADGVTSVSSLYSRFLHGIRARSQGHAIVIVDHCEEGWVIADPAAGKVIWSEEYLAASWDGEGVYLRPR